MLAIFRSSLLVTTLLSSAGAVTADTTDPLKEGLIAHWQLNGDVLDASPNKNDGVEHGVFTYTKDRFGVDGNAANFNGRNTYISVPDNWGILSPLDQQWTISLWAKGEPANGGSNFAPFIYKGDLNEYCTPQLEYSLGRYTKLIASFGVDSSRCPESVQTKADTDPTVWHHYVAVADRRGDIPTLKLYVDGALIEPYVTSKYHTFADSSSNVYIGGSPLAKYWQYWKGSLDEIRLYNRALSADEVSMLNNEGKYPQIYMYDPKDGAIVSSRLKNYEWALTPNATNYQINVTPEGWKGGYSIIINAAKFCNTTTNRCVVRPNNFYLPQSGKVGVRIYALDDQNNRIAMSARVLFSSKISQTVYAPIPSVAVGNDKLLLGTLYGNCLFGGYCQRAQNTLISNGIDIMLPIGTEVRAICKGVVVKADKIPEDVNVWNRFVIIKHSNCAGFPTLYSYYGHIDIDPKNIYIDKTIAANQRIGTIADWGDSSRLHFALKTGYLNDNWGYIDINTPTPDSCDSAIVQKRRIALLNRGWVDPALFGAVLDWSKFNLAGGEASSNCFVDPAIIYTQSPVGLGLPYTPWQLQ